MTMPKMPSGDVEDFHERLREWRKQYSAWAETPEGKAELERIEHEREAEEQAERSKQENERARKFFEESGVPRRVRDVLDAGPADTTALQRVKRWVGDRGKDSSVWCLVLSSTKGAGKSVAAGWWMRANRARSITYWHKGERKDAPAWLTAAAMCRINAYSEEWEAICKHPGPIVIDDLGSEYNDKAGFLQTMVDSLMDARYSEYRPILITTNLNAQAFKERYSERVADRIREGGSFFEFRAESMRRAS